MIWKASSQISQASSNLPTPSYYKPWIRTAGEESPRARAGALPVHLLWMLLCLAGFSGSPPWREHMLLRVTGPFFIMSHRGSVTLSEWGWDIYPSLRRKEVHRAISTHEWIARTRGDTQEEVAAPWLEPKLPWPPHPSRATFTRVSFCIQLPHPFRKHREEWRWEGGCSVLSFPGLNLSSALCFSPSYENLPFALSSHSCSWHCPSADDGRISVKRSFSRSPSPHTLPSHVARTYFHEARRWQKNDFSILKNYSSSRVGWEDESSENYIHTQAQLSFSPVPCSPLWNLLHFLQGSFKSWFLGGPSSQVKTAEDGQGRTRGF